MAEQPPKPSPGSPAPDDGTQEQIARDLARSLGMDAAGADAARRDAAEADAAAAGTDAPSGEGRLKLDKSGALIGIEKLRPVRAHPRPEGEAPSATSSPGPAVHAAPSPPRAADERRPAAAASTPPMPGAPKKAALPARIGAHVPAGFPGAGASDGEVAIAGGGFLYGEDRQVHIVPGYRIDRVPVTHDAYERFVRETGHRPPLYWPAGHMPEELRDHPVVGVDYFDALAYARWQGKDLPFEDEWERAARGTDGRSWPWGEAGDLAHSNTARQGLKMTLPVGFQPENESPDGVQDMVGNVWELTHSPAPGGGVVVRGGSWFDFAFHAKTWFRFAARPTARNGTIGFRCVRRTGPRHDAASEVDPSMVEGEIAGRRGAQPPVDPSQFSPDRRDLVPDYRRLRVMLAERQVADAVGGALPSPSRPSAPPPPAPPMAAAPAPPKAAAPAPLKPVAPPAPLPSSKAAPHPSRPFTSAEPPAPAPLQPPAVLPTPSAPAATTPVPVPVPVPEAPLHVLLPTGRAASASFAPPVPPEPLSPAAAPFAGAPASPAAPEPPPSLEQLATQRTPRALWILLAVGFALLLGLLVWLLDPGAAKPVVPPTPQPGPEVPTPIPEPPPEPPPTPAPDVLADLPVEPAAGEGELDGQPPRLLDGATGTWPERFAEGAWLLVFAGGPDEEAARLTREAALSLHRRLLGRGIRVALVVGRSAFETPAGTLLEPVELEAQMAALEARDGLTLLLDPRRDGRDAIREARYALRTPNAAVLLVNGEIEVQTQPPEGGMSLKRLQPIAKRARDFVR